MERVGFKVSLTVVHEGVIKTIKNFIEFSELVDTSSKAIKETLALASKELGDSVSFVRGYVIFVR